MRKASESTSALKFAHEAKDAPLDTKIKLRVCDPLSLLSWGGDNWGGSKDDIKRLETPQNKAIRQILGMSMSQVKEEEATKDKTRMKFGSMPKV